MHKVFAFRRLNIMGNVERKEIILDEGYRYFQAYHDCLYCYDSLENVKNPDDPIYTVDVEGEFVLVNFGRRADGCELCCHFGDADHDKQDSACARCFNGSNFESM